MRHNLFLCIKAILCIKGHSIHKITCVISSYDVSMKYREMKRMCDKHRLQYAIPANSPKGIKKKAIVCCIKREYALLDLLYSIC